MICIEPPDGKEPPSKPELFANSHSHEEEIELASRDYWFKISGIPKQQWALIEPCRSGSGVVRYEIDDNSCIVDRTWFEDETHARLQLMQGRGTTGSGRRGQVLQ